MNKNVIALSVRTLCTPSCLSEKADHRDHRGSQRSTTETLLNPFLRIPRPLLFAHKNNLANVVGVVGADVGNL
jgi:hypothetical protein